MICFVDMMMGCFINFHQVFGEVPMFTMYVEVGRHLKIPCDMPEETGRYAAYWYKETNGNQVEIFKGWVRICICIISNHHSIQTLT